MATLKQERALAKIVENRGNVSRGMIEAGYSPATAKNPKSLTESKAWQELMKKHFPDSKLAVLHKKVLEKKEVVVVGDGRGESHWEYTGQPHTDSLKALETAYKLKARYPIEQENGNKTLVVVLTGQSASRYDVRGTNKIPTA